MRKPHKIGFWNFSSVQKISIKILVLATKNDILNSMEKMITIRQPYASALFCGVKRHEYRNWRIKPGVRATDDAPRPDISGSELAQHMRESSRTRKTASPFGIIRMRRHER